MPLIEPVYPLTAGLSPKILGRAIRTALERLPELAEWQDAAWKQRHGWPDFSAALKALHNPQITEAPSTQLAITFTIWPMTNFWPTNWR